MADQADIDAVEDAIIANAQRPKREKFAGREIEQHSLGDQIKAAEFIAGEEASVQPHFGLRFTQLIPPGCG